MSSPAIHCLFLLLLITISSVAADETLTVYQALESYGFPIGLLPVGVTGYELDTSSGKFKAYLDGTCSFKVEDYELKSRLLPSAATAGCRSLPGTDLTRPGEGSDLLAGDLPISLLSPKVALFRNLAGDLTSSSLVSVVTVERLSLMLHISETSETSSVVVVVIIITIQSHVLCAPSCLTGLAQQSQCCMT